MVFRQGQLKGQVYNIEHPTSCFYNLTKPLTRQDLLPYQVYVPWSWEAKPTRIAAADDVEQPRSCKEAKDFDEIPTVSAVYGHSCNPDSTFLLVAMYKSICVCGCQWGVYATTWPIKKKKAISLQHHHLYQLRSDCSVNEHDHHDGHHHLWHHHYHLNHHLCG